ncbi:MAG: hypothetical protein GY841_04945 [FCB group bacterium]|nr:hypothetical protein [FCB group bacterium]
MPKKNINKIADYSGRINFAAALMIFIFLLHFLPLALPKARLWGINHLLFLSPSWIAIVVVAGLAAIALLLPSIRKKADRLFTSLGEFFFSDSFLWPRLIFCLAVPLIFWLLRMPTNLLGDGYTVVNNVGNDIPVILKWSEIGAIGLVSAVASLLPLSGVEGATVAYALVSVVSGGLTIYLFCALAHELGDNGSGRLFILALLMFSGWTLLFFGYAENYPILWPFMIAYLYFGLRYIRGRNSLAVPTIIILIAALIHMQSVFFLLSFPFLLVARGKGRDFYLKHTKQLLITAGVVILTGVAVFVYEYQTTLEFMIHFLPPFSGRLPMTDYAVFSPTHLLDILNELSLLIPVWPVLLMAAIWGRRGYKSNAVDHFLLAYSAGGAVFLLILDPRLGMGRDWDLFALTGLGPLLYLLHRSFNSKLRLNRLWPGIALLSLVLTLPYFVTNLSYQPSIDYMKSLLHLDMPKSRSGMIMLRDYLKNEGNTQAAANLDREIWKLFPANRLAREASKLSRMGKFREAMAKADSLYQINPYTNEALNTRGMIYLRSGNLKEAIRYLEMSARFGRYEPKSLVNISNAYYQTGQFDKMLASMRKAQKLDPDAIEVLQGLAMGFYAMNEFDSALVYGHNLIAIDSTVPNGHFSLGLTYYKLGRHEKSKKYLTRFLEFNPPGADRDLSLKLLTEMAREGK